jgi:hypothetical protein
MILCAQKAWSDERFHSFSTRRATALRHLYFSVACDSSELEKFYGSHARCWKDMAVPVAARDAALMSLVRFCMDVHTRVPGLNEIDVEMRDWDADAPAHGWYSGTEVYSFRGQAAGNNTTKDSTTLVVPTRFAFLANNSASCRAATRMTTPAPPSLSPHWARRE